MAREPEARDLQAELERHGIRSLAGVGAHPLHAALFPHERPRRACRAQEPVTVRARVGFDGTLSVPLGGAETSVRVDARTRIANRPAYEPIRPSQRLELRYSSCAGGRVVADEITFVGAPGRRSPDGPDGDRVPAAVVPLAGAAILLAILIFVAGRLPRSRGPR